MSRTVAIMQPYFFPYAGYFRLMAQADHFVIFDCVQFPRRGYVHRNRLPSGPDANLRWLTLPLAKAPRETLIADLRFSDDAQYEWSQRLAEHPTLKELPVRDPKLAELLNSVSNDGNVVDYLEATLTITCERLGLKTYISRSSELKIGEHLRGEDRIIAIAKQVGADIYLNSPGGRHLYDNDRMAQAGIALKFLNDYQGAMHSVLYDLALKPF